MQSLRVNETKRTLRNAFILDLFVLGGEKESKYNKTLYPYRNLTCLLTLSLQKTHIRVFPDYFSFKHFLTFLLLLDTKSKFIEFCTKF